MTKAKFLTAVTVFILTICAAAAFSVYAATSVGNAITSAVINKNKDAITVTATLSDSYVKGNRGKSIYLFELMPESSGADLSSLTPIAETKVASDPAFSLPLDVTDKARLLSGYVIAELGTDGSYSALTDERFITNADTLAQYSYTYPTAASKKGLEVQLLSDAQELGVSYAVINVSIDSLLQGESSSDAVSYIFDSRTYYVSRAKLDSLDHRIKVLSDSGTIVYLNIILSTPDSALSDKLKVLYYPDALTNTTARLCAVNTGSADAVLYYAGLLNFLADRYTNPESEVGFAGGWIIGYEVNSNRNYNFMGPAAMADYADAYVKALRIADTMLRSVYSNGRVYVSVANNFNAVSSELNFAGDEALDYSARLFLERVNQSITLSGDFPWNLSINPYPSDPANTSYWTDPNTLDSFDTPYITMKNIGVICDFMKQDNFLYSGAKRRILVGSFGVSGEAVTSGEALQAAAFAYAYYTVASNDDLEALIWHRHVDSSEESGMLLGLWTTAEGSSLTPAQTKSVYDIFKYIDTERFGSKEQSEDKTAFALKLIGVSSWSDLIPNFDINKVVTRGVYESIAYLSSDIDKKYKESTLFDFSSGNLFDFYPTDNADYVELRTDSETAATETADTSQTSAAATGSVLYASLSSESPFEYMGVSKKFTEPLDITLAGYITLRIKAELPEGAATADLMLRLLGHKTDTGELIVYEGESQIKPGEWSDVTFKLTDYAAQVSSIDSLKIWVKSFDNKSYEGSYGLLVQNILLYAKTNLNVLSVVLWVILILFIAVVVGFFGLVARNQIRYRLRLRRQHQRALQKEQARRGQQVAYPPVNKPLPPGQTGTLPRLGAPTGTQTRIGAPASQQPRQNTQTGMQPKVNAQPHSAPNKSQTQASAQPKSGTVRRPQARRKPPTNSDK
jgi:hypothetical protein